MWSKGFGYEFANFQVKYSSIVFIFLLDPRFKMLVSNSIRHSLNERSIIQSRNKWIKFNFWFEIFLRVITDQTWNFLFHLKFPNEAHGSDVLENSDNDLTHDPSVEGHDWESPAWVAWSMPIWKEFYYLFLFL